MYRTDQDGSIVFEIKSEIYDKTKDYSKERHKVVTYFEIGKLLYEAGSIYVEDIIGKYFEKLMIEVGKKYNRRTLYRTKQFYIMFCEGKVSTLSTQLSWSHYRELITIKNPNLLKKDADDIFATVKQAQIKKKQ